MTTVWVHCDILGARRQRGTDNRRKWAQAGAHAPKPYKHTPPLTDVQLPQCWGAHLKRVSSWSQAGKILFWLILIHSAATLANIAVKQSICGAVLYTNKLSFKAKSWRKKKGNCLINQCPDADWFVSSKKKKKRNKPLTVRKSRQICRAKHTGSSTWPSLNIFFKPFSICLSLRDWTPL